MAGHCSGCVFTVCVCSLCALWMGQMQSTNSKYGSPYLVVCHFHFTLYLQNLNSRICTSLPVPVFGCLQNLIVKFKDHDYYVLTDWSYDYWLSIFECVFSSRPGTIDYIITSSRMTSLHCKKTTTLSQLKILRKPASADFWVFSTYFLGNFSTFCCINLKQLVEKTQKSAKAGCLNFKLAVYVRA